VGYNKEGAVIIDEQHVIFQSLYNVSMMNELVVPPRKHVCIISANEFFANLNAHSQLVFTPTFKEMTRIVLLSQEGYFDPKRPSIVIPQKSKGYYSVNIYLKNPLIEQKKMTKRQQLQKRNDTVLHIHYAKTIPKIKTINTNIC